MNIFKSTLLAFAVSILTGSPCFAGGDPTPISPPSLLRSNTLTIDAPQTTLKVSTLPKTSDYRLVYIEVTHVVNPQQVPVTFTVLHTKSDDQQIRLGSFALYPANHPGQFIVPVTKALHPQDSITIKLIVHNDIRDNESESIKHQQPHVEATLGAVKLVDKL